MSLSSLIAPEMIAALAAAAGPAALIWAPTGRIKRILAEIETDGLQAAVSTGLSTAASTALPPGPAQSAATEVTAEGVVRDAA